MIKSTTIEAEAEENILTRCVRKDGWVKIGKDTGGYPVFVKQWGGRGSGDGQFRAISGMEVDKVNDVIYVTDFDNARLQKFSSDGNFLSKWVGFDTPWGIGVAVDSSGYVYVADAGLSCVYKFSSEGNLVTKWGSEGSGAGQFQNGPTDIYIDKLGNVYVTDTGNCRIQKFTSGGVFIKMWGGLGSGAGQFKYPYGIAGDDSGNIYVADSSNYRVQKFSSDGTFVGMWGGCDYPQGIAVDSTGNVYVGERFGGKKVKKFTSDGALLFSLSEFRYPIAIGIDLEDNIYIADGLTNYIKKFVYPASLSGVIETAWSGEENLFSFVEFLPVSIIPEETGAIEYECTTDGENWFDVPEDFNLMSVDASSRKIKFRITLSRISGEDESPALDKIVVEYVTTGEERADNGNTVRLLNTKGSAAQTPMKMDNENVFEFGEVYAYPNPARMKNPKIHIETGKADKATIKIYDMAGLPVHQVEMNHSPSVVDGKYIYEYLWDTSGVASGVYIYSVKISKEGEKDIQTVKRLALLK
ncbi:MAG: hypothetical protein COT16_03395 [Elusimicrobia bacterium CG08_land_8_20_14_0_20_44_26]|nr:MAG: hypothetical protein COT16_03395 [Elusimicrobia bacterium CG08_land_8_20_14_0_20_44_26]